MGRGSHAGVKEYKCSLHKFFHSKCSHYLVECGFARDSAIQGWDVRNVVVLAECSDGCWVHGFDSGAYFVCFGDSFGVFCVLGEIGDKIVNIYV